MGPKKDPKEAKKEVIVGGKNLASLKDEELLLFQKQYQEKLVDIEKENALSETEVNMLRNAWKSSEDKLSESDLENIMIRRKLDESRELMDPESWKTKENIFDKQMIYAGVKKNMSTFDEENGEIFNFEGNDASSEDDPESVYDSRPSNDEEKFDADVKHIKTNKRLNNKKQKFYKRMNELKNIQEAKSEFEAESSKAKDQTVTLDERTLEDIVFGDGSISSDSISEKTGKSIAHERRNIIDDALAGVDFKKRKQPDTYERELRNLALLKEKKWSKVDSRYDDFDECHEGLPNDDDRVFDDFNPIMDEDVDDAVHYYQMKKWLDYDADAMVAEMKNETHQRMKAINYVWTKDVRNALEAELQAAEEYDQKLREDVQAKIEKELDRTQKNQHHLKLLLQTLEEVRMKMVRERFATKMSVEQQQAEEYNFLVQESYDRTVNQLKASSAFNFNTTQAFFMRTTENDISLTHELHAEQKRIEKREKSLKIEVHSLKKELATLEKPLEEQERITRWMETAVASLQKDMRSKHDQERVNFKMTKEIQSIGDETSKFESENKQTSSSLDCLQADLGDVDRFQKNFTKDNFFLRKMTKMTKSNERKIIRLKKNLKERFGLGDQSFKIVRNHVLKNVERCKRKRLHNLLETKAFNEMATQLDLRAKDLEVKNHIPMEKLVVNYRKTSANIITTFEEKKIINSRQNRL